MIIKTTSDGTFHTNCSYQHNLEITCGECTVPEIVTALRHWERGKRASEEGITLGNLSELPSNARKSYINGYIAGNPATPEWATIKADALKRIGR